MGLIAERVSDVRRVEDGEVTDTPGLLGPHAYLGPVVSADDTLIPLLAIDRLLAEPLALAEAAS